MKPRIGCSGWQYPDWEGKFYPDDIPKSHWFEFYTQQFNTVEINYSHYHMPSDKTVKIWQKIAPKNFRYSLKVHRVITHYKKFNHTQRLLNTFYRKAEILEDKLGCILFQLPANVKYNLDLLKRFIDQADTKKRNVIEFRDKSWWREDVYTLLKKHKIVFCSIDAPNLPKELIPSGKIAYIRFHGNKYWYRGDYSKQQLSAWVKKINQQKSKEVWIYFNNDIGAFAPKNAKDIQTLLKYKPT